MPTIKFLDTFTQAPTRVDGTAPLAGHAPDTGSTWENWQPGPYDAFDRDIAGFAIKAGVLTDYATDVSGTDFRSQAAAFAQIIGLFAVGDSAFVDVKYPVGSGTPSQLWHLVFLLSSDAGTDDMPLTNGYVALEFDRASNASTVDVYGLIEFGRVGGGSPGGSYSFEGPYSVPASDIRVGVTLVSHTKLSTAEEDAATTEDGGTYYERWGVVLEAWTEPYGGGTRTTLGQFTWNDEDGTYIPGSLLTGSRDRAGLAYDAHYTTTATGVIDEVWTDDCESTFGWTLTDPAGTNATLSLDSTKSHTGLASLHVHLAGLVNPGTVKISKSVSGLDPDATYEIHYWWYRTGSWGFLGQPLGQWNPQTLGSLGQPRFLTSDSLGNATLEIIIAIGGGPNSGADEWIDTIVLARPRHRIEFENLTVVDGVPCDAPGQPPGGGYPGVPPPPKYGLFVRQNNAWRFIKLPDTVDPTSKLAFRQNTFARFASDLKIRANVAWRNLVDAALDETYTPPDYPPYFDPCEQLPPTETPPDVAVGAPPARLFFAWAVSPSQLGPLWTATYMAMGPSIITAINQAAARGGAIYGTPGDKTKFFTAGRYDPAKMNAHIASLANPGFVSAILAAQAAGSFAGLHAADDWENPALWPPIGLPLPEINRIAGVWKTYFPGIRVMLRARSGQIGNISMPNIDGLISQMRMSGVEWDAAGRDAGNYARIELNYCQARSWRLHLSQNFYQGTVVRQAMTAAQVLANGLAWVDETAAHSWGHAVDGMGGWKFESEGSRGNVTTSDYLNAYAAWRNALATLGAPS